MQLLGLCPLLAVTTSVVNAVGLGAATLFALVVLSTCVSATRRWVQPDVRLPIYVLILASAVTMVDLAMHAWAFELHERLGIFVPLIVTNCAVLGRAESFARRHSVRESFWDAVSMGLGFGIVLACLARYEKRLEWAPYSPKRKVFLDLPRPIGSFESSMGRVLES